VSTPSWITSIFVKVHLGKEIFASVLGKHLGRSPSNFEVRCCF